MDVTYIKAPVTILKKNRNHAYPPFFIDAYASSEKSQQLAEQGKLISQSYFICSLLITS